MADEKIVISAIARVIDLASAPLKAIMGVFDDIGEAAGKVGGAVGNVGAKVGNSIKGLAGRLGEATGKVGNFVRGMGAMIGPMSGLIGLAGIGGAAAAMREFVNEGDALYKMATRLGTTVETIQLFRIAADNVGLADDALANLQKTMAKVARGGKEAEPIIALLKKMGVTAEEMKLGNLEAILPKIMEGFKQNENQVLKTNAALLLFGKSGQAQLEWLSKGAEAAKAAREQMERLGYISTAGAKSANAAADQMTALGFAITGVRNVVGEALIPAFLPMIKWLTDFIASNRELLKQVALPAFIGALAAAVVGLGIAVAAALGPWGLLAGAIVAAGVAIYQNWGDIIKWLDKEIPGLTSTISTAGNAIAAWAKKSVSDINEGFKTGGLAGGVTAYVNAFKAAWMGIGEWFADLFRNINWTQVGTAGATMLWEAFKAIIRADIAIGQFLIDQWKMALDWIRTADWGSIGVSAGKLLGDAIMLTLKGILQFHLLVADMGRQLGTAIRNIDWSEVLNSITVNFLKFNFEMIRIGKEFMLGLIKGMLSAIPGLSEVVSGIKDKLGKFGAFFEGVTTGIGNQIKAGVDFISTPALNPNRPNLLAMPGAGGGTTTQRSEVAITNKVIAAPGSTVTTTTSQTGAMVDLSKVGQADFAVVPQ